MEYRNESALTSEDTIRLNTRDLAGYDLYFYQQLADYVPFPSSQAFSVRPEWLDLTNQQLMDIYGVAFAGAIAPQNTVQLPRIFGQVAQ